jgi:hypothetical protein
LKGVQDGTAWCEVFPEHRGDGLQVDHFGMLPVLKSWDSPGEIWVDDLRVEGLEFDFADDPHWEGAANRRKYVTTGIRPKFDFGWSPTGFAGGAKAGELGGVVYRGDCREPHRMGCYGGRIAELTFDDVLEARGKLAMLSGVSDSTASIGFYHSGFSMRSNPSQKNSVPADYLGFNIEGPSSEGFFFYPVYRDHGEGSKAAGGGELPRIYPDGEVHDWSLRYDPEAGDGTGRITLRLDDKECILAMEAGHRETGAKFNRFGICTPWVDGNAVKVYVDDLWYTDGAE